MGIRTTFNRLALAGTLALTGAIGTAGIAGAQDVPEGEAMDFEPTAFTSELTGFDIELTGDNWEITDVVSQQWSDASGEPGDAEVVSIESEGALGEINFFDDTDTPEQSLDTWQSSLEGGDSIENVTVIEEGEDDGVFYRLLTFEVDGNVFVYYMQVTEDIEGNVDMMENIGAPEIVFQDEFDTAQEEVTIDGNAFADGVDSDDLLDMVDAGGTGTPVNDDSDDADDDADDDSTPQANESETGSLTGFQTGNDDDADATTEADDDNSTGTATSGDGYTFDLVDLDVEFSDEVSMQGEPIVETGVEGITLVSSGQAGLGSVMASEVGMDPEQTLDTFMDGFGGSMDSIEEIDRGVDGDDTWGLYVAETSGVEMTIYVTVSEDIIDDAQVLQLVAAPTDDFEEQFQLFQDEVEVDGDEMFDGHDVEDIVALM